MWRNEDTTDALKTVGEIFVVLIASTILILLGVKPTKAVKSISYSHTDKLRRNKFAYMNKHS